MKLLKSRGFALPFCAVICALSLCLGFYRSASAYAKRVSMQWEEGVYSAEEGYTPRSAKAYGDARITAAFGLYTTGAGVLGEGDRSVAALREAITSAEAQMTAKSDINLEKAFKSLQVALSVSGDAADYSSAMFDFEQQFIGSGNALYREAERYNAIADEFFSATKQFPFGFLRYFIPINDPVRF